MSSFLISTQINNYNKNCIPLYVITISDSRWRLFSFSEFQMQAIEVNHSRKRGSKNLVIGLLRFFKQDLMLEFFTLRALQLYLILITGLIHLDILTYSCLNYNYNLNLYLRRALYEPFSLDPIVPSSLHFFLSVNC